MSKIYEVDFYTKKGGLAHWVVNVEGNTTKEARAKAENMWENDNRLKDMHMFNITVRKLKDDEEFKYHYFVIRGNL